MKDSTVYTLRKLDKVQQAQALQRLHLATQRVVEAHQQVNEALEAVSAFDSLMAQRLQEGKIPAAHFGLIDVQRQRLLEQVEKQRAHLSEQEDLLEKAKILKRESDTKHEIQNRIEDKWRSQKRTRYERKAQHELDEIGARLYYEAQNKKS